MWGKNESTIFHTSIIVGKIMNQSTSDPLSYLSYILILWVKYESINIDDAVIFTLLFQLFLWDYVDWSVSCLVRGATHICCPSVSHQRYYGAGLKEVSNDGPKQVGLSNHGRYQHVSTKKTSENYVLPTLFRIPH